MLKGLFFKEKKRQYAGTADGKILCISDLHSFFREDREKAGKIDYSRYLAVLFPGDIRKNDAAYVAGHVPAGIPCLFVPGNHDEPGQYRGIPNLINIGGGKYTLRCGTTIGGAGGSPRAEHGDAASQPCTRTEQEVGDALKKIGSVDILATHESPFHLLNTNPSYSGYRAITKHIKKNNPAMHVYGHHHFPDSQMAYGTKCICVYGFEEVDLRTGEAFQLPGF